MRVLLLCLLCACKPASVEPAVRFVTRLANGADARAPLIVAIHGRGDRPESFAHLFDDFAGRAELALPQASSPFGDGWSWFEWPPDDDALAANVAAAEARLWPAIAERARGRRLIVTGFSQGGVLSFVLAARHPDAVALALPLSGGAPRRLWPRAPAAPVYAQHGDADRVVGVDFARATVAAFKAAGGRAELRESPGVGHSVTAAMKAELLARLDAALTAP